MVRHAKMFVYTGTNTPTETVAVDSTNSYYSQPISVMGCDSFSIQVKWTEGSSIAGTLYLQVSNDPRVHTDPTNANWVTTDEVFPANPAGSTATTAETFSGNGYAYARLMYTNSSGSGTLGPVWANAQ